MKFLIYGINFSPEVTGIGKYTGEMVQWLVQAGHEVRVVTAPPYYPAWRVSPGYSNSYSTETWHGAQVWRCPLWVPAQPNGKRRVLHLLSFAIASLPVVLRHALWRPDVVWMAAPAFACAPGAWLTALLCRAKSWLHVQDYEVDVAFDMGMLRGRRSRAIVTKAERFILRRFDVVSTISQRMVKRAVEKKVDPQRIAFFPNWVDTQAIRPDTDSTSLRQELGIAPGKLVALFSGTLGAKQGLQLLPEVARLLAVQCPKVQVVVCGDGVMKPHLEAAAASLPNLQLLPLQPVERFGKLMALADIHLLTQDPGVADLVMPSKLAAMLASGRPVVATVLPNTEVGQVVAGRGVVTPPGDAPAMAQAIAQLADDTALRRSYGAAARACAEQDLSAAAVLARFERHCEALVRAAVLAADDVDADVTQQGRLKP